MGQAMERGLYMIEIIREESYDSEQEKRELPKNIRQIGSPDIGDRIYIENKVLYADSYKISDGCDRID